MAEKPTTAAGYTPEQVARVKAACLYLATKLGDLMPEMVVVGGLVPSLLIDQEHLPADAPLHVGTMDLDVGLAFAVLNQERYKQIEERLRLAGFKPDTNSEGNPTRQRWRISEPPVTVDFLIEPAPDAEANAGRVFRLTKDLAAIIAPGLHLAFQNSRSVKLRGRTIIGENVAAGREIRVCGAGAFVILKALALRLRGESKDAYDLYYMLRNYGEGVSDLTHELRPLLNDASAQAGLRYLAEDFADLDSVGPRRAADFLHGGPNEQLQADAAGFVAQLLAELERVGGKN
ncbi:MAG TPA: hypothetical protein VEH27_13680 [Methylomirabilota bacterium]|nr:hypothetical protein [Methylomirabilota bacterium]